MDITVAEERANYARIDVAVTKADYEEDYNKRLKNIAAGASLPGFRKGHTPKGLIAKMYGQAIHVDAVSEAVSSALMDFIKEKGYKTIGQPFMPKSLDQGDKLKEEEMTLTFDVALTPELPDDLLTKEDHFTRYTVAVTDEEVTDRLDRMRKNAASYVESDHVVPNAFITGTLAELDGDTPKEGGLLVEGTHAYPDFMTDEEEKAKFVDVPKDSIVIFNPYKAFNGAKSELKALFRLDEMTDEQVEQYRDVDFSYEIQSIGYSKPADLDQEFFDSLFGEDQVHCEEEAHAKIREAIENDHNSRSNYLLMEDLIERIAKEKSDRIELADDTIREWFLGTEMGEGQSDEQIGELIRSIKVDMVVNQLAKKFDLSVTEEDLRGYTRAFVANQFAQMGLSGLPDEILDRQVDQSLADDRYRYNTEQNMLRQMVTHKVVDEGLVTIDEKQVTTEEMDKIYADRSANPDEETAEEAEE